MRSLLFLLGGKKVISAILAFSLSTINFHEGTFNAQVNLKGIFDTPVLKIIQLEIPVGIIYRYSLIITTEGKKWLHKGSERKTITFHPNTNNYSIVNTKGEKLTFIDKSSAEKYLSHLSLKIKVPQNTFEGSKYSLFVTAHLEYMRGANIRIPAPAQVWQYFVPVFKKEGFFHDLVANTQ